jgi:hypothetical protein
VEGAVEVAYLAEQGLHNIKYDGVQCSNSSDGPRIAFCGMGHRKSRSKEEI